MTEQDSTVPADWISTAEYIGKLEAENADLRAVLEEHLEKYRQMQRDFMETHSYILTPWTLDWMARVEALLRLLDGNQEEEKA